MAPFIGRLESVGIGREATRGVGVPAAFALPKTNISFDDKANKAVSMEALGHIGGFGNQAIVTQLFSAGNIDGEIGADSFGLLLYALFGGDTVTTVLGAKKHSFALANSNQHQTLTIYGDNPVGDRVFEGCMLDSLEIEITTEDIVKFTAGFKGKKGQDTVYAPVFAYDYKFVGRDLVAKVAENVAGLAAASGLSLKSLRLAFNKNAEHDFTLGTMEPEGGLNKQFTVEGTIVLNYETNTIRNYMLDGTYRALSILLSQSRDTIGTNNPAIYFELPRVDFFDWERDRGNDDPVTQSINLRGLVDLSTGTPRMFSDAYIINNVTAY